MSEVNMQTVEVAIRMPKTYAVTKNTQTMVDAIREALSSGKVYSQDDIKRVLGRKWVSGALFYATRLHNSPEAPEFFPIVALKRGRRIIGYVHKPLAASVKRNALGHPVKVDNVIGKWEQRPVVASEKAAALAAAAQAAAEAAAAEAAKLMETGTEAPAEVA